MGKVNALIGVNAYKISFMRGNGVRRDYNFQIKTYHRMYKINILSSPTIQTYLLFKFYLKNALSSRLNL
jgi:hypothetical protein